jgi:hypothetical protein
MMSLPATYSIQIFGSNGKAITTSMPCRQTPRRNKAITT